jgi:hypothetical protein
VFNTVLISSSFPAEWNISKIVPFTKRSDPTELGDYRPINVLPVLSKVMEIVMQDQ